VLQTLGQVQALPNNGSAVLRGVVSFIAEDDLSGSAIVYAETAHPGMTVSFSTPQVRQPRSMMGVSSPTEDITACTPSLSPPSADQPHENLACIAY
jgi:hypothetical protein